MFSVVMYVKEASYIKQSIDDIRGFNYKYTIDSITIINDSDIDIDIDGVVVVRCINKYNTLNDVCRKLKSKYIIFCFGNIKIFSDTFDNMIAKLDDNNNSFVTPLIYGLNCRFWTKCGYGYKSYGFRWDMNIIPRYDNNNIVVHPGCFALSRIRLYNIDMFDDQMSTDCAITELCIRNILLGGDIISCDGDVGCDYVVSYSVKDAVRIVEQWLSSFSNRFLKLIPSATSVIINRDNLKSYNLYHKQVRSIDYLLGLMPENNKFFDLYDIATNKFIGVICDGPSSDYINSRDLLRYNLLIGVNFSAIKFQCDYAVCDDLSVASKILGKFPNTKLLMPYYIIDHTTAKYINITDIFPDCIPFQSGGSFDEIYDITCPIINYENMNISAIHLAMVMGKNITVFGCDNKFVNGKLVNNISVENDFHNHAPSESINRLLYKYENGLKNLSNVAMKNNIIINRYNLL